MPKTVLGKVSLAPRGTYSSKESYTALDLVGYDGGGYIALKDVQGVAPGTDEGSWMLLASQGGPGPQGQRGETGYVYIPAVSPEGVVSWTNDGGLDNPEPVNITGPEGPSGPQGASITSIQRTEGAGAPGTTDTYTVYLAGGAEAGTFQVYNGADGSGAGDFKADGSVPMTGALQMGGHKVTGVADATEDGDAVNKGQMDAALEGVTVTTDATPTEGSTNPVQSGGVFADLAGKADTALSNLSSPPEALVNLGARPRRNLLNNWYLVGGGSQQGGGQFPINRRGIVELVNPSSKTPFVDRWMAYGASATMNLVAEGIQVESETGATTNGLIQVTEAAGLTPGETYTLSALVKILEDDYAAEHHNLAIGYGPNANSATITNRIASSEPLGEWLMTSLTFVLPESTDGFYNLRVRALDKNTRIKYLVQAVKLELGPDQTLARQETNGNWKLLEIPDYAQQFLLCSQYADDGAYIGILQGIGAQPRKNLLDNWYFVGGGSQQGGGQFPINQRGKTEYDEGGYATDRWIVDAAYPLTVSIEREGIVLTSTKDKPGVLYTKIPREQAEQYSRKMMTISMLTADGVLIAGSGLLGDFTADTGASSGYVLGVNVGISMYVNTQSFQLCRITLQPNTSIKIVAVKSELGPGQTLAYQDADGKWQLYETPDYAAELRECQRYLLVLGDGQRFIGNAHLDSATFLQGVIWTPVPMRINPSISGALHIYGVDNNLAATGITPMGIGPCGVRVNATIAGGVNSPALVFLHSNDIAPLTLSAEL